MNRPEDALIPLVAAALLVQMLMSAPLRFGTLFPPVDAPKPPFVQTIVEPERSAKPHPVLVRDHHDHFAGAS